MHALMECVVGHKRSHSVTVAFIPLATCQYHLPRALGDCSNYYISLRRLAEAAWGTLPYSPPPAFTSASFSSSRRRVSVRPDEAA